MFVTGRKNMYGFILALVVSQTHPLLVSSHLGFWALAWHLGTARGININHSRHRTDYPSQLPGPVVLASAALSAVSTGVLVHDFIAGMTIDWPRPVFPRHHFRLADPKHRSVTYLPMTAVPNHKLGVLQIFAPSRV